MHSRPRRLAIIGGGGASGLAALRVISERREFKGPHPAWELYAFESRRDVGGIWLPEVPSEKTTYPAHEAVPPTPLYQSLTTNIPHPIMAFHDFPFPPETPLFPHASVVLDYLRQYAQHFNLRQFIRFDTKVLSANWDASAAQWTLETSSRPDKEHFDALIIANGHYGLPYTPHISGQSEWIRSGKKILHSIYYREPSIFAGLTVLIVGGGPSGNDLVTDSTPVARRVIHSVSGGERSDVGLIHRRSRLTQLDANTSSVIYSDGTSDADIDIIVLATGYELIFSFLMEEIPHPRKTISISPSDELECSISSIFPLARQTFPLRTLPSQSIAFIGLPARLAPFPAADIQALAVAAVFFDSPDDGASDSEPVWDQLQEEQLVQKKFNALVKRFGDAYGASKQWHKLISPADFPGPIDEGLEGWETYRESLLSLAARDRVDTGTRKRVETWATHEWEKEMYKEKATLRAEWVKLEAEGVSGDWLKGVGFGKNGSVEEEWVAFARKVLEHARSRNPGASAPSAVEARAPL